MKCIFAIMVVIAPHRSRQRTVRCALLCIVMLLALAAGAQDSSYSYRAKKYIEQYYPLAVAEQKANGIPAAVTLAQGLLETEAGKSELMTQANNHFGIKCKNGWTGETFSHDDDAPGECFKKYKCAADSYRDHSDHLKKNQRYAQLFSLSKTDYAAWARGLKKCGYATNPQYAERLIKIIEDYSLQAYTFSAMDSTPDENMADDDDSSADVPVATTAKYFAPIAPRPSPQKDTTAKKTSFADPLKNMADSARQKVVTAPAAPAKTDTPAKHTEAVSRFHDADSKYDSGKIVMVNGLRAFYALKGEMLLKYAVQYHVRYPHLLEVNDLADTSLPFDMYVYLDRKLTYGTHAKHTVADGETLLMIAQEEGMQMKRLMALNYLHPGEEPATGAVIDLQSMAPKKPVIKFANKARGGGGSGTTKNDTAAQANDYITLRNPEADTTPTAETPVPAPAEKPYVEYVAGSDYKGDLANNPDTVKGEDGTPKEDLSGLKAELDKVVYADDSNLPVSKPAPAPAKKPREASSAPAEKKAEKYYKVKKGDTAFGIAKKNNITVKQLLKWNDMDASDVKVGKTLRVKE